MLGDREAVDKGRLAEVEAARVVGMVGNQVHLKFLVKQLVRTCQHQHTVHLLLGGCLRLLVGVLRLRQQARPVAGGLGAGLLVGAGTS